MYAVLSIAVIAASIAFPIISSLLWKSKQVKILFLIESILSGIGLTGAIITSVIFFSGDKNKDEWITEGYSSFLLVSAIAIGTIAVMTAIAALMKLKMKPARIMLCVVGTIALILVTPVYLSGAGESQLPVLIKTLTLFEVLVLKIRGSVDDYHLLTAIKNGETDRIAEKANKKRKRKN